MPISAEYLEKLNKGLPLDKPIIVRERILIDRLREMFPKLEFTDSRRPEGGPALIVSHMSDKPNFEETLWLFKLHPKVPAIILLRSEDGAKGFVSERKIKKYLEKEAKNREIIVLRKDWSEVKLVPPVLAPYLEHEHREHGPGLLDCVTFSVHQLLLGQKSANNINKE